MRKRLVFIGLLWLLALGSCVPNKTCPAFQSYFILNEEVRKEKFSKFDSDSLPKFAYGMKRTKYGVGKKVSYRKKKQDWNTIDMKVVMPDPLENIDSIILAQETYDPSDSLLNDQATPPESLSRRRDKYNEDQLQYMQLFGKYLRKPVKNGQFDPSQEMEEGDNGELGKPEKKKGLFGFLKKKDKKEQEDPDLGEFPPPEKKSKKKKKKKDKDKEDEEDIDSEEGDLSDTSS